jgi:hypothetical protein
MLRFHAMPANDIIGNLNELGATMFHGNGFGTDQPGGALYSHPKLHNPVAVSENATVEVHFDRIEDTICDLVNGFDVVVGAVAWFTNLRILQSLGQKKRSGVVVQKEDFLRKDSTLGLAHWKSNLRALYDRAAGFNMHEFTETYPGQQEDNPDFNSDVQNWLFDASGLFVGPSEGFRCIGHRSNDRNTLPRMHHKFLVLGEWSEVLMMHPKAVVTGSFNMTQNATLSRENIIVIYDKDIAQAYLSEWAQLWAISEPLDWQSDVPVEPLLDMQT